MLLNVILDPILFFTYMGIAESALHRYQQFVPLVWENDIMIGIIINVMAVALGGISGAVFSKLISQEFAANMTKVFEFVQFVWYKQHWRDAKHACCRDSGGIGNSNRAVLPFGKVYYQIR
jgi:hypothetical protein